jgi:hypothetical protein
VVKTLGSTPGSSRRDTFSSTMTLTATLLLTVVVLWALIVLAARPTASL